MFASRTIDQPEAQGGHRAIGVCPDSLDAMLWQEDAAEPTDHPVLPGEFPRAAGPETKPHDSRSKAGSMSISDNPYPTVGLQELVHRAWLDLKQARQDVDLDAMMLAERRMNAFLDKLAVKTLPTGTPSPVSRHPSATVRGRL